MALLTLLVWGAVALITFIALKTLIKFRKTINLFNKHKVPYLSSSFYRTFQFFTGQTNIVKLQTEIYKDAKETKAPLVGATDMLGGPSVIIMDLDLARHVYVKDFEYFSDRRPVETIKTNKYFQRFLFAMEGDQWKGIRTKLSPSFTTSRIKNMFDIFKKSSERMDSYLKEHLPSSGKGDLELATLFPKYAMDVIASSAFGVDSKTWDVAPGQQSVFEKMGHQFQIKFSGVVLLKMLIAIMSPKLMDQLGLDVLDKESGQYFDSVIKSVMKRRRETGERREDFLQLMMDAQQGILKADEETKQVMNGHLDGDQAGITESKGKVTFDDEDIVANGMLFLQGGFDPTQSVLIFVFYCLALNPEVQDKLYKEVQSAKAKNGGELTYQGILEMNYLDMVINETMRLYTPSAATERRCTKDYKVPGMSFVIPKGYMVTIPFHPLHLDERYFPNPEKFIPERFSPEEKAKRHPYAFTPFGLGPRSCIGMRFALVKLKAVIAQLVGSYQFAPCSQTNIPVEFGFSANIKPVGGMWLNVTARKT